MEWRGLEMAPFLAGALFGGLFIAAAFVAFLTRARRSEREIEPWADPFEDEAPPVPVVIHKSLIQRRNLEI